MSTIPIITPSEIPNIIKRFRAYQIPVFFHGPPGCGKSSVVMQTGQEIADDMALTFRAVDEHAAPIIDPENTFGFIDYRAVTADPADIKGFGHLDINDMKTTWLTPDWLPDVSRHGKYGILFLDELPQASPMTQAGFTNLTLDRRIGSYVLPDGWQIVIAGNRKQDGANANKVGAHLLNRNGHFEVAPSAKDWARYENANGGDPRVSAFIQARPELLFNWQKGDIAFGTMRSWSNASRAVKDITDSAHLREQVVGSFVGTGPAVELEGFLSLIASGQSMPTWNQVINNPAEAPAPDNSNSMAAAMTFAVIGMIANNIDDVAHMPAVITYLERLPKDFQTVAMGDIWRIDPDLFDCRAATQWRSDNPHANIGD
jgi:hypothetical protein